MIKTIIFLFLSIALTGCASVAPDYANYGHFSAKEKDMTVSASYIQFNKDYAVSVKHGGIVEKPDYVSSNYDLIFFKHKAKNFSNSIYFRNPSIGEKMIHVGFINNKITVSREGVNMNQKIHYLNNDYEVSDAVTMKGMSGGPIYSTDKTAILGMSIAKTDRVSIENKVYPSVAVFIPAHVIEEEWAKFQGH